MGQYNPSSHSTKELHGSATIIKSTAHIFLDAVILAEVALVDRRSRNPDRYKIRKFISGLQLCSVNSVGRVLTVRHGAAVPRFESRKYVDDDEESRGSGHEAHPEKDPALPRSELSDVFQHRLVVQGRILSRRHLALHKMVCNFLHLLFFF